MPTSLLLILNAIVCAIYYGFITSLSTFTTAYPFLTSTTIGLCFLGIGGGMTIGSWGNGRYLDWEFRRVSKRAQLFGNKGLEDPASFPFEQV
jgi:predicted MFS family arabinose efflux permease